MSEPTGGRYSVSIGGDASGPVVAGHDNTLEITERRDTAEGAATDPGTRYAQDNRAADRGTVFAVSHGDMHVHQTPPAPAAPPPEA
ncbi:hypothetical protein [Streptomonospora nanhaiensis]|uniref:hypothetical protein n=1 Tax=Streptomonospora nanhaiensis TaxID=1323731 RepID=UPI001C39230E|nr:hypothetical protein [Streptomonospora nanhaiensis]MBV2364495.1 hypothetical protein [Streptomonospora nanhaiensis]